MSLPLILVTTLLFVWGWAIMRPLQAAIIDRGTVMEIPAVNASFILPLICFTLLAAYGYRACKYFQISK